MQQHIHISDIEGKPTVCYDTGLDPRSFARTKMSQCLTEPGYVVHPDGSNKVWKAAGINETNGFMRVWGEPLVGERLNLILEQSAGLVDSSDQAALQAVVFWIRSKMLLGETNSAMNPGAAFICCKDGNNHPKGSVFFGPTNLSNRCLLLEGEEHDPYNCPDLYGMEAAAFCAGTMLYKILSKELPYQAGSNIYQDMREGVFLPPSLAIPGLDKKLVNLIHTALLLPVEKKRTSESGADILGKILEFLMNKDGEIAAISSLFQLVSKEEDQKIEKDKKSYLKKQKFAVKSRRFYFRNKAVLIGSAIAVFFVLFVAVNMVSSRNNRPTTAGMDPAAVVYNYYEAFSNLNHAFMEASIMGADKSDINVAVNFFAITRVRQAHEPGARHSIISARVWRELGGELPAPDVFGVTDLTVNQLGGSEYDGIVVYRAEYLLWFPHEPIPSSRSDELILRRHRGNWRIIEINRTMRSGF